MNPGSASPAKGLGLKLALAFAACAVLAPIGSAAAAVNSTSANATAVALEGSGGSASATSDPAQYGVGDAPLSGFPVAGGTFGALSSGEVEVADDPNSSGGTSFAFNNSDPARGIANDPATLKVDFTVPAGQSCLLVDYKFLSEEFPEFVNAGFNDAFVAELDTTSWSVNVDPKTFVQKLSAPNDFAAGYGDEVAVDTVGPTIVTEADAAGTTYDAATATLTAKTAVSPGAHSVYLSVFDAGDTIYDSAVFVDNLRFNTEPPSTCKPPDLFGGAVGVTPASKKINFAGKTGSFDLTCQLPEGASDPCIGDVVITAPGGGGQRVARRAKKTKVATGAYSVQPATTGPVTVKLTKKGKRLLKSKGSTKGKAKVTNTVNGTSDSFKLKLKK